MFPTLYLVFPTLFCVPKNILCSQHYLVFLTLPWVPNTTCVPNSTLCSWRYFVFPTIPWDPNNTLCSQQYLVFPIIPCVPNNNSVRIEHWNNLEYEEVPEVPGGLWSPCQIVEDTTHDPWARTLSRMYPAGQNNNLLVLIFYRRILVQSTHAFNPSKKQTSFELVS